MKTINHVALLYSGRVFCLPYPYRHHHLIQILKRSNHGTKWNPKETHHAIEGFLTNDGEFVNRTEAMRIMVKNGQKILSPIYGHKLFSENLWVTPGNRLGVPNSAERAIFEYNENPDVIDSKLKITSHKRYKK